MKYFIFSLLILLVVCPVNAKNGQGDDVITQKIKKEKPQDPAKEIIDFVQVYS